MRVALTLSQGGPTNVIVKLSSTFINLAQFVSIRFIETGLQLLRWQSAAKDVT